MQRRVMKLKEEMTKDKSCILIVLDHKQKILPMKYREGQIEYFGKKGMSLLGTMHVVYTEQNGTKGYRYSFEDYIVSGYTGQGNVQVGAVVMCIINRLK